MGGDNAFAAMMNDAWTDEDWEDYRKLPWLGRRLADVTRLLPATERWLLPLIARHANLMRRRAYEKARRTAQARARAPRTAPTTEPAKPARSLRR